MKAPVHKEREIVYPSLHKLTPIAFLNDDQYTMHVSLIFTSTIFLNSIKQQRLIKNIYKIRS